ncbi:hypothetical protein GIHI108528_07240 [Gillisia hiemivivida]
MADRLIDKPYIIMIILFIVFNYLLNNVVNLINR